MANFFCYGLQGVIEIAIQIPLFQVEKLLLSSDFIHFPVKVIFNIGNYGIKIMLSSFLRLIIFFGFRTANINHQKFILLQINCDLADTLSTTWLQLLLQAKCRTTDASRNLRWRQIWYSVWHGDKWRCKNHKCIKHCINIIIYQLTKFNNTNTATIRAATYL